MCGTPIMKIPNDIEDMHGQSQRFSEKKQKIDFVADVWMHSNGMAWVQHALCLVRFDYLILWIHGCMVFGLVCLSAKNLCFGSDSSVFCWKTLTIRAYPPNQWERERERIKCSRCTTHCTRRNFSIGKWEKPKNQAHNNKSIENRPKEANKMKNQKFTSNSKESKLRWSISFLFFWFDQLQRVCLFFFFVSGPGKSFDFISVQSRA